MNENTDSPVSPEQAQNIADTINDGVAKLAAMGSGEADDYPTVTGPEGGFALQYVYDALKTIAVMSGLDVRVIMASLDPGALLGGFLTGVDISREFGSTDYDAYVASEDEEHDPDTCLFCKAAESQVPEEADEFLRSLS